MIKLKWWMRIVGMFYLLMFVVNVFFHLPIKEEGPKGALALADAGDPLARFVVDTWFTLGMEFFVLGAALLSASGAGLKAKPLVLTIFGIQIFEGIVVDIYKIARGNEFNAPIAWIVINTVILLTGYYALKKAEENAHLT